MSKLPPGTYTTRRPLKVIWHIAAALVAAVALQLPFAVSADAGPHRAQLSSELAAYLASGSTGDIEVIFSGTTEKAERLARRYDIPIKKLLSSGVVFTVSRRVLDLLSQDLEVETLSDNAKVHSHMALTTEVTGADAAWSGAIESLGEVNGSGIGVAVIDSGIAKDHPALQNRVIASFDFTDRLGRGEDFYGHGTHVAG